MYRMLPEASPRVGSNQARSELTVILKPWEDRKDTSIDEIMSNVRHDLSEYPECKSLSFYSSCYSRFGNLGWF